MILKMVKLGLILLVWGRVFCGVACCCADLYPSARGRVALGLTSDTRRTAKIAFGAALKGGQPPRCAHPGDI